MSSDPSGYTPSDPAKSNLFLWSTIVLLGVPFLSAAFIFWAAATQPWFFAGTDAPLLGVMGYGAEARGLNCEVVLFGDSTALADFAPAVVTAKTGMTACNISEIRSNIDTVGVNDALDLYLRHNNPPRFIVTGWTPDDLNLGHKRILAKNPENVAFALRYTDHAWLWKSLLRHPATAIEFVGWSETQIFQNVRVHATAYLRRRKPDLREKKQRDVRFLQTGQWATKDAPQVHCTEELMGPRWSRAEAEAGITAFRKRYESIHTQVLVYVTPVADCDIHLDEFQATTKGLTDNTLESWPVNLFNLRDVHLTPEGSQRFTGQVADDLVQRLTPASR